MHHWQRFGGGAHNKIREEEISRGVGSSELRTWRGVTSFTGKLSFCGPPDWSVQGLCLRLADGHTNAILPQRTLIQTGLCIGEKMCFLWLRNLTFSHLDYGINHKPKVWTTSRELRMKRHRQVRRCRHKRLLQEIFLSFPPSKIMVDYFNIFISFSEDLESNICPKVVQSETFRRLAEPLQEHHRTANADRDYILLHVRQLTIN